MREKMSLYINNRQRREKRTSIPARILAAAFALIRSRLLLRRNPLWLKVLRRSGEVRGRALNRAPCATADK
jgi:hypothetical protein